MTSTTFSSGTTIASTWLNEVNTAVHKAASGISGASDRTAINRNADWVSVKDFGAVGDGTTDDTTALNAAIAYEQTNKKGLIFPAGTYKVTSTLAFLGSSLRNLTFIALGNVTIYNTGSGPVATLDSGGDAVRCDNIIFDGFILKGNALSTYGLETRGVHRSYIRARAYDIATAGFHIKWSVLTEHKLTVSDNIDTFSVNPGTGLIVSRSSAGNYTACSKFHVVMEGPITTLGIDYVYGGLGNIFTGSCENIPRGFKQQSTAFDAILLGMDFEGNSVYDVQVEGRGLKLVDCDLSSAGSSPNVTLASSCSDFAARGGFIRQIDIDSAAAGTTINDVTLSDNVALGITGTGSSNWRGGGNVEVDTNRAITAEIYDQSGARSSYTASLTGCTTVPTSSITYRVDGDIVTLDIPTITGTSNTTAATLTGMPAAIRPSTARSDVGTVTDNSGNALGRFVIETSGTITLHVGALTTFTGANTKGVQASTITYKL